jgi:hypothetical protein
MQAMQQQQMQQSLMDQAGQLARAPAFDPSKQPNPNGEQSNTPTEGAPQEAQVTGG